MLTGKARYVENLDVSGCLFAAFLRSTHAHACIKSIDTTRAVAAPGVVAVFTGVDLLEAGVGPLPFHEVVQREDGGPMQPPARLALASDRVRFSGEAIALVIAQTRRAALDALEHIQVDYDPLPVVVRARMAHAEDAPLVADGAPRNVVGFMRIGDKAKTDAVFARAAHVTRLSLTNQRLSASPMETRSVIASWDRDRNRLTLFAGNQAPHMAREQIARCLGIPNDDLRIVVGDIGGGFGMKLVPYPEEVALLFAARSLKASIRWKADRTESFLSDTHGRDHDTDAEMAFDREGRILGVRMRVWANMGAYLSFFGITVATGSGNRVVSGVYRIPTLDVEVRAMLTNTAPVGPYRGAGRPEAIYRLERLLDVGAAELGMDPVTLRRINLITPDAIPYLANSGQIYESGNFPRILDQALAVADWAGFDARREAARARGQLYGGGICCHIDTTSGIRPFEQVGIVANALGRIDVFSGTQAMGQGIATVYASMVATRLGIPIDHINIVQGDTDRVPDGVGSYGSRSLFIGGSAVVQATEALVDVLRQRAAAVLASNSGDLIFEAGRFAVADRSIGIFELLARTGGVEAQGRHESKFVFPNGCYVCEAEIDPETGVVTIARFSGVDDVGTVIHPMIVHGQVQGSIAQGIAQALYEEVVYDDEGQLLSASFMDYALPRADVLPRLSVETDETSICPTNPLGAKGAGEAGCLGAPPAVVGAVMDALAKFGVRHLDMPLTPEKIWRAMRTPTPACRAEMRS
ncbi:MAG: xanthine dehydrogenase family protein molybdopterin-binding subunit [Hyphomicrobiaceae bacterium]|nr:MAG: xanthine dehydrogenase family protein molybdopterin-binding subunit [Hyphomicrobiaceae bacterium]